MPDSLLHLDQLEPMFLTEGKAPFSSPDWVFELRHDGYRMLAQIDGGGHGAELRTCDGIDATSWFPEVVAGLRRMGRTYGRTVIDGEVCVLDGHGRSNFERIDARVQRRCLYEGADMAVFCAWDVLVWRSVDVRHWPLERRKSRLAGILAQQQVPGVRYVQHIETHGEALYERALVTEMEGIVAKRLGSVYASGERTADWLQIKRPPSSEAVVRAVHPPAPDVRL